MKDSSPPRRTLTTAQRGQIIQRIIVDGWTRADAATTFGVPERLVDAWVADYRRHGMASLRHKSGGTIVAEIIRLRVALPLAAVCRGIRTRLRGIFVHHRRVPPLPLRRSSDDGRGGGS